MKWLRIPMYLTELNKPDLNHVIEWADQLRIQKRFFSTKMFLRRALMWGRWTCSFSNSDSYLVLRLFSATLSSNRFWTFHPVHRETVDSPQDQCGLVRFTAVGQCSGSSVLNCRLQLPDCSKMEPWFLAELTKWISVKTMKRLVCFPGISVCVFMQVWLFYQHIFLFLSNVFLYSQTFFPYIYNGHLIS